MKEQEHYIKAVENNKEKALSYRENFKRYNKAKNSEFYLECLWILYAMLEDRTSAFLYYLGFTSDSKRTSVTGCKRIKTQIRQIFKMNETNNRYQFDTMFGKISRMNEIIDWSLKDSEGTTDYQNAVKSAVENISKNNDFLETLKYLNTEWRDKRNQLTHALFNKRPEMVNNELKSLVDKGYTAVRDLDNAVAKLKKEKIRRRFKIQ
ncbi:MAG: hypothetical protein E7252_09610 [Lachnospira sp.]|nr:hypothetical protein [Lachnospira sp.]